ncbi:MAG: DUF2846 domain-containing protein [Acidobacteriota bacterium]|nr:DUF2846 domain-containing protein [Acidobacteriota bacterium]
MTAQRRFIGWIVCFVFLPGILQAGSEKRLRRALDWPTVDLSGYERVFVEDCEVTDPEAPERKIQDLVKTVPARLADYIDYAIDRDLFPEVLRRAPKNSESGVVLRVNVTRYKPGSFTARWLVAGTSSANFEFDVTLIDAQTGNTLQTFSETRSFNWGGLTARSITLIEERAAVELGAYLSLSKGMEPEAVLARLRMPFDGDGPPEIPHGTVYIMRPQGMVGGANRFRVGIDDVTIGESKRNTYHMAYVAPGEHRVWWGRDKWQRDTAVTIESGKDYYFQAMGLKEIPPAKALKKLKDCRLIRTMDLTDRP